jgi:hypothetical protein
MPSDRKIEVTFTLAALAIVALMAGAMFAIAY